MKKLIIANWKMSPITLEEAEGILRSTEKYLQSSGRDKFDLVFCPPFVFLEDVLNISQDLGAVGAQDISTEDSGALTGEVSGPMLQKLGAKYVIIGHSERRWKLNESDEVVNKKLKAALRNGLIPVVCIGEKARDEHFKDFLASQIGSTFQDLGDDDVSRCIIAYEPVWAISSNPGAKADTPISALESISHIREILNTKYQIPNTVCLYGGSVNSGNAGDFLKENDINGVLVGSASVKIEEFIKILEIADRL